MGKRLTPKSPDDVLYICYFPGCDRYHESRRTTSRHWRDTHPGAPLFDRGQVLVRQRRLVDAVGVAHVKATAGLQILHTGNALVASTPTTTTTTSSSEESTSVSSASPGSVADMTTAPTTNLSSSSPSPSSSSSSSAATNEGATEAPAPISSFWPTIRRPETYVSSTSSTSSSDSSSSPDNETSNGRYMVGQAQPVGRGIPYDNPELAAMRWNSSIENYYQGLTWQEETTPLFLVYMDDDSWIVAEDPTLGLPGLPELSEELQEEGRSIIAAELERKARLRDMVADWNDEDSDDATEAESTTQSTTEHGDDADIMQDIETKEDEDDDDDDSEDNDQEMTC